MHKFLVSFQLETRFVQFNERDVLAQIIALCEKELSGIPAAVDVLAKGLSSTITSNANGRQTSAASKIVFFSQPCRDVYIWDTHARRSARFRDWLSVGRGTKPPRLDGSYVIGRTHDYSMFCDSCANALKTELLRDDFGEAIEEFRTEVQRVGGPMADSKVVRESSFIERRFLDKLMFWEGKYVKEIQAAFKAPVS